MLFNNISTEFTGAVVVNGGLFQMNNVGQINASSFTINGQGMMLIDNNGTTSSTTRILDTTPIILNSAVGGDATTPRGLWVRNTDNNSSRFETIGELVFNSGASYLTGEANVATGNGRAGLIAQDFVRNDDATFAVRGRNLGTTTTHHNQFRIVASNEAAFISSALVGGGGAAGGATISILPWAIGETHNATTTGATNMGNSLVTYVAGTGLRPLNLATEYVDYASGGATSNVRQIVTTDTIGLAGRTLNALVIHNHNTAAATVHITGAGAGQSLINSSGTALFTLNPAATASSAHRLILGGFDDGLLTPSGEYLFHVVNPSAAADTAVLTVQIDSSLASAADLTKSGRGTLVLTQANLAGGGANKTTLNEGILEIGALDHIGGASGQLVFAGGTLRLGTGFTDDLSDRSMTFLLGGGTLDTNGMDLDLANSLGTGLGGFTKTGNGILTLNAAANYAGPTVVEGGVLAIGANNATGVGGNLTLLGGATLDLGANTILAGQVTVSGAEPVILGTGTINASGGYLFNQTGDASVAAALAGGGGLLKLGTNSLTLTGASTYASRTEVQAGTLVFDSIGNVGSGPSALGSPLNAQEGIIRMGLTTGATALTYTGTGHSSDRLIGIQGTTGGVTLNADGTGAVAFGGVIGLTPNSNTLTLRGTSDPALENRIGAIDQGVINTLTLNKTDANTWMITGASSYTGVTQIDNGTLKIGVADALPVGTTVRLGTGGTAGVFDLNGYDQTVATFLVQTNSATLTNHLMVEDGNIFTVNGNVTIGSTANTSTTLFAATGGGDFVNTNIGGTFQVGGSTSNYNAATADFSGLGSFTVDLGTTGTLRIGDNSSATGATGGASTLILAEENVITAGLLQVSGLQPQTLQTLRLGSGTNELNVNILSVGSNHRGSGTVEFADSTGSLVLRAADGSGRAEVRLAAHSQATNANNVNAIDLTGHDADLFVSTLTLVDRSASGGAGGPDNQSAGYATFSFNQGTFDAEQVIIARRTGSGSGDGIATLNLGGGTVTIGTTTMAVNTSAGGIVEATLNITGGDVTFGSGSGTAINMANAGTGRAVTSEIQLTGGMVNVTGNIIRQGGAGTENATVTLDGSVLDMAGNAIGTSAAPITLAAQSGTLSNLAELNSGGVLTKTTAGSLSLGNGNTYTGGTTVSAGSLFANNTTGSATGSGAVSVATGATLGGSGLVTPGVNHTVTIDSGATLTVGNLADAEGADLRITTSGTGELVINGKVEFDIWSGTGLGDNSAAPLTADRLIIGGGPVVLGGTLAINNPNLLTNWAEGDIWRLFDWALATSVTGSFSNITSTVGNFTDLPELDGDLRWDTTQLYTQGTLSVVMIPEPSRALLVLIGLFGAVMRRRRK
jgi:fibronectin-binding autotransporter adhesin